MTDQAYKVHCDTKRYSLVRRLLLVMLLAIQLAACGSGGGSAAPDNSSSAASGDVQPEDETLYLLSGSVEGLQGEGLTVVNGGTGESLELSENGPFAFSEPLAEGDSYAISVQQQPSSPSQQCSLVNASGSVDGAAIPEIAVSCATSSFTVGGSVSGLQGSGLRLQLGDGELLAVDADGGFAFSEPLSDGSAYRVQVVTQPSTPSQQCTVENASGALAGEDVNNVQVNCIADSFTVGGTVSGLVGSGLTLKLDSGELLEISDNGAFLFNTSFIDTSRYRVSVVSQPSSPHQVCALAGASGVIDAAAVEDIQVQCVTSSYAVGGSVEGLAGTGLALQLNGGEPLTISANGAFTFGTTLADNSDYSVTLAGQPSSPSQTCVIANAGGTVNGGAVEDIKVSCATNSYTIGGAVSGLEGSGLVLQNNGGDDLAISASGSFAFPAALPDGSGYAVTVAQQPASPLQRCSVEASSGVLDSAAVTDVVVTCQTLPVVTGTVPTSGAAGVEPAAAVEASFSKAMLPSSLSSAFILSDDSGMPVPASVSYDEGRETATLQPELELTRGESYTATVLAVATDAEGLTLPADYSWSFTVRDGAWGSAQTSSVSASEGVMLAEPSAAVARDGTALLVWAQAPDADSVPHIYARRYSEGNWGEISRIDGWDRYADAPHIVMNEAGQAVALWPQVRPDNSITSLYAAYFSPESGWSAQEELTLSFTQKTYERIAIDTQGNALAVWKEGNPEDSNNQWLWGNYYQAGSGWQGAQPLIRAAYLSELTIAFKSDGEAVLGWRDYYQTRAAIYTQGTGLQGVQTLADGTNFLGSDVAVATDEAGNAVVGWKNSLPGSTTAGDLMVSRYSGGEWQPFETLTPQVQSVSDLSLAMTAGEVMAGWRLSTSSVPELYACHFTPEQGWGSPQRLGYGKSGKPPLIATDESGAWFVWVDSDGSLSARRYASGLWGAAEVIQAEPGIELYDTPQLTTSRSGRALLTWSSGNSLQVQTQLFE
jgi:hypothetical protein